MAFPRPRSGAISGGRALWYAARMKRFARIVPGRLRRTGFLLLVGAEVRADPRASAPALTSSRSNPFLRRHALGRRPLPPRSPMSPADANMTPSGLASKILAKGKGGAHPGPHDRVIVHYTGWTSSGRPFDSSIPNGEPTTLALDAAIAGLTEGLQLMARGEKRRFWIPSGLAYGDKSTRLDAPAGAVVFDVELVDFIATLEPPQVPLDVDAVPKDAKKTASGSGLQDPETGQEQAAPRCVQRR